MGRSRTISDPGGTALPRCWMIKSLLLSFTQNEWQTSATGNARDARTRVNSDSGSGFIGTYARTASSQNRNTSYMSVGFGTKNWRENRHDAAGICQSRLSYRTQSFFPSGYNPPESTRLCLCMVCHVQVVSFYHPFGTAPFKRRLANRAKSDHMGRVPSVSHDISTYAKLSSHKSYILVAIGR